MTMLNKRIFAKGFKPYLVEVILLSMSLFESVQFIITDFLLVFLTLGCQCKNRVFGTRISNRNRRYPEGPKFSYPRND